MKVSRSVACTLLFSVLLTSCSANTVGKVKDVKSVTNQRISKFAGACPLLLTTIQSVTTAAAEGLNAGLLSPLKELVIVGSALTTAGDQEELLKTNLIGNSGSVISDLLAGGLEQVNWNLQYDQMTAAYAYCSK